MGIPKHGRCRRGIRPALGSIGRPQAGLNGERLLFWQAIAQGHSTETSAGMAGVSPAVGARWFRHGGGMPDMSLKAPTDRYLTFPEREEIALLKASGRGVREIARSIGRSPSTVSRELRRNAATRNGYVEYRAITAQWHAHRRSRRPRTAKLVANAGLRQYVQDRLAGSIRTQSGCRTGPQRSWRGRRHGPRQDRHWASAWSPEQISNRLPLDFPEDPTMRISHEAIYQALYIQGRGALSRDLCMCLRSGRPLRVPRKRAGTRGKQFVTTEVMIARRPPEVNERRIPGHWEGDLILGLGSSAIGTVVERSTRYTVLLHLPRMKEHGAARKKNGPALAGHGADAVRCALTTSLQLMPEQMRHSLTWDQGAEMTQHIQLRLDTGLAIYFCDPHSPWQRGTNENTNGLLRQYFPKGTDLSRHQAHDLAAVAIAINNRPRKVLGWRTPAEALAAHLSSFNHQPVATTG
jgi:IS30 family transposase